MPSSLFDGDPTPRATRTPNTAQNLTLFLKHHTLTTLLSLPPTASLTALKVSLLSALSNVSPRDLPPSLHPIPDSPEDVVLGVLIDKEDVKKGFERTVETGGTVRGAGIGESEIIAFRWRRESEDLDGGMELDGEEFPVEWPREYEEDVRVPARGGTGSDGDESS